MSERNCRKCKYFNAFIAGNSKYVTLECPNKQFDYDINRQIIDGSGSNIKFSRSQAEMFFKFLPEECIYYDEINNI